MKLSKLYLTVGSVVLLIALLVVVLFLLGINEDGNYSGVHKETTPSNVLSEIHPPSQSLHLFNDSQLDEYLLNLDIDLGRLDYIDLFFIYANRQIEMGKFEGIDPLLSHAQFSQHGKESKTLEFKKMTTCIAGRSFLRKGNFTRAEHNLIECFEYFQERRFNYPHLYGHSAHSYGLYYHELGKFEEALVYYNLALEFRNTSTADNQLDRAATLNNIGNIFWKKGQYTKALSYHERSLLLKQALLPKSHPDISASLNNIGVILNEIGEYEHSLQYHLATLKYRREILGDHSATAHSLHNLAEAYLGLEEMDTALKYALESLQMKERVLGQTHPSTLNTQTLLANIHSFTGNYSLANSAIYYPIFTCSYSSSYICDEARRVEALNYINQGKIAQGVKLEKSLISDIIKSQGIVSPNMSTLYLALSKYYSESTNFPLAIDYAKKGIFLDTQINYEDLKSAPTIFENLAHRDRIILFLQIISNSYAKISNRDSNSSLLVQAMEADGLALRILEESLHSKWIDISRKRSKELSALITKQATQNAIAMHRLSNNISSLYLALGYVDYGYNWALKNQLIDLRALQRAGAPDSLLNAVKKNVSRSVEFDISASSQSRLGYSFSTGNDLFHDIQNERIKDQYPLYHEFSSYSRNYNLSNIHRFLKHNNTSLIEYYSLNDSLYALVVNGDSIGNFNLGIESTIQLKIDELTKTIDPKKLFEFIVPSSELYKMVFEPVSHMINGSNLLIVPNSSIQKISFDMLISQNLGNGLNTNGVTYLIDQYSISYSFSSAYYFNNGIKSSDNIGRVLALAPIFDGDEELSLDVKSFIGKFEEPRGVTTTGVAPLLGSLSEVNQIRDKLSSAKNNVEFETNILIRDEVTEHFIKTEDLSTYSIVHLASHSFTHPTNPFESGILIELDGKKGEDGVLHAHEIFGLNLNAELVILSACDTALSSNTRSVNLSGLAHSFFYAGAKSLIASLWPSDDLGTRILMGQFYSYLSGGMAIESAFRTAKLELSNDHGPISHPYYWAGFVHIGANAEQSDRYSRFDDLTMAEN